MKIDSIKNGIVLDHIQAGKSMEIYRYLGLDKLDCSVAIIKNAVSNKMVKKAERYGILDEEEGTYTIQSYLLAQFGKNYSVDEGHRIDAVVLMSQVNMVIEKMKQQNIHGLLQMY